MTHPRAFVITLKRTSERYAKEQEHLRSVGISAEPFYGLDAAIAGLQTDHTYEVDNPGTNYHMGPKLVALYLSHYMLWRVLQYLPEDVFWVLEDDAQWDAEWAKQYAEAMSVVPKDWDLVWLGSCCTGERVAKCIAKNLYDVRYPLCTHAYQVHKKALATMIDVHQKVWAPLDLALMFDSMPQLNVYTILPRLAAQWNTCIQP